MQFSKQAWNFLFVNRLLYPFNSFYMTLENNADRNFETIPSVGLTLLPSTRARIDVLGRDKHFQKKPHIFWRLRWHFWGYGKYIVCWLETGIKSWMYSISFRPKCWILWWCFWLGGRCRWCNGNYSKPAVNSGEVLVMLDKL